MKSIAFVACGLLAMVLAASALVGPTPQKLNEFTLVNAVPNGVFLCVTERNNPERDFLDQYWGEVVEALKDSGIHEDVIEMFGSLLGSLNEEQAAELERVKNLALRLVEGVDWEDLAGKEFLFAEKFVPPKPLFKENPPILQPHMVWLFRGSSDGAAKNYRGLTAILDALVEEVNKFAGAEVLAVDRSSRKGGETATVDLMAFRGAITMPISVALRDDVIVIGMREQLFSEVLDIMDGVGGKKALSDNPRFQSAFAKLPPAEDLMTFFDMQTLLKPIRTTVNVFINEANGPRDCYMNSGMPTEVNGLNGKAMAAYQSGDIEQALELTRAAHDIAPENSIILYNLACFNAEAGNRDKALAWLKRAVEGGFYAPGKISTDEDLTSLHGESEFETALARAAELATRCNAKDRVINYAVEGEVYRLRMQVNQTYETRSYEQGLNLIKQAYAIDSKDSKVLYTLACLHTLLGHEADGLDFLERAVDAGFYCPNHMSRDPDLETVRDHERFKAAKAEARKMAGEMAIRDIDENAAMAERIIDRLMNAAGVLDYVASVETTDGYTTEAETIAVLVPDAKERPVYKLFGKRKLLTDFEKYLPEETLSFAIAGGIDFDAMYEFILDTVRIAGAPGEEALAKWREIQNQLGFDLRKDVIDWIDGDSISVTLDDGIGSVTLMKVHDEETAREKIAAAIEFTTTKLREIISEHRELAGLAMLSFRTSPLKHDELEGFQNLYFSMVPQPMVWGVADGYLIFGSSADAIALCMATARGEHPNIRNNKRVMSEALVPDGPFAAVTLTDQRGLGQELEEGLGIATMVTGMMSAFVPEPEVKPVIAKISTMLGKLTPVVRKIDFYKSSASLTTFDGQSWHSRGVTHYFSPQERAAKDM